MADSSSFRVLYVAVQMPEYPRNNRVRRYLKSEFGAQVDMILLSRRPGFVRHCVELLVAGLRAPGRYDVVILSELSLPFAFVSWILARLHRAIHVVDFFVGLYETHVEDRGVVDAGSLKARAYQLLELIAARSANVLLTDTDVRAAALSARFGRPAMSLAVGAPPWAEVLRLRPRRDGDVARLLYYGNYIPLHGIVPLIEAFSLVAQSRDFAVTMLGDGDHRAIAEESVSSLGLGDRVRFLGAVPEAQLSKFIEQHDIVLGIFGTSPKASSVIANKVWQGLACGRIVITRESGALQEIMPLVGDQLRLTEGGSAESIAAALRSSMDEGPREFPGADGELESYVQRRYAEFGEWLSKNVRGRARVAAARRAERSRAAGAEPFR